MTEPGAEGVNVPLLLGTRVKQHALDPDAPSAVLNASLTGLPASGFTPEVMNRVTRSAGAAASLVPVIVDFTTHVLEEAHRSEIYLTGQNRLLGQPEYQDLTKAQEVLEELRERGHYLAVATGKSRRGLDRVLAAMGMESFFHATRCADETASKPDPRMVLEIIEELGAAVDQAVMVGDTEYDMEMARRAGALGIGVSYGVHSQERLARPHPSLIVGCLSELLVWVPGS